MGFNRLFGIIIQGIIFIYVWNLEKEKCKCSKHWMRDFIKYYSLVLVCLNLVLLLLEAYNNKTLPELLELFFSNLSINLVIVLMPIMLILSFTYAIISLVYFFRLHQDKECKCSMDWKRYALITPLVFGIVGFLITLVMQGYKMVVKK